MNFKRRHDGSQEDWSERPRKQVYKDLPRNKTSSMLTEEELRTEYRAPQQWSALKIASSDGQVQHTKQSSSSAVPANLLPTYHPLSKSIASQASPLPALFSTLPPLPSISSPALQNIPFTHRGSLTQTAVHSTATNYERLEFLGDAYLELMATLFVTSHYPTLYPGKLSQIRQQLVRNDTLAKFSLAYGFDKRMVLPKHMVSTKLQTDKRGRKVLGDVFEAYVAAVIQSDAEHGYRSVEKWMDSLWSSVLGPRRHEWRLVLDADINADEYNSDDEKDDTYAEISAANMTAPVDDPLAKQTLSQKIVSKGCKIAYSEERPPKAINKDGKAIYYVCASYTGFGWEKEYLASGEGDSLKEAGRRAAARALLNPLTDEIAHVKREEDRRKLELETEKGGSDGSSTTAVAGGKGSSHV